MRQQWNERVAVDPLHYVLNRKGLHEWTMEDFLATGDENCRRFLEPLAVRYSLTLADRELLEIGCGVGRETRALAARFKHVIALDVSDAMLDQARQNVTASNVTFVRGSGVDLAVVTDGAVDFAYSVIVFQHIPDVEVQYTYLREVGRVLRPGGWFFIHLYADEDAYPVRLAKWQARAEAGELRGWSEAARRELEQERYLTSMQTAVAYDRTLAVLQEAGLTLRYDVGAHTDAWWIGGSRDGD